MQVHDLEELYLVELEELRSVQSQLIEHLAKMTSRATDHALSTAIKAHQTQMSAQRDALDVLLKVRAREVDAHEDTSMHTIIVEAQKWNDMIPDDTLRDAALVASLQRIEHYKMAVLGTLATWARKLGQGEDEAVLTSILAQTKQADAEFTAIAEDALAATLH